MSLVPSVLPCLLFCLAPVIAGCNSQMDSIETPVTRQTSAAPAGIYEGSVASGRDNTSREVMSFLDGDNRFITFSEDGAYVASGVYTKQQNTLTLNARHYEAQANGMQTVATFTAVGSFNPEVSLLLSYIASDGDFGTLSTDYRPLRYERRSDLPLLQGTWVVEDEFGTATTSFDISQDGNFFGQDGLDGPRDDTCTYAGRFDLIQQQFNLYRISLTRQCRGDTAPLPTTGLATLLFDPVSGLPTRILSASNSAAIAVVLSLQKS